MIDVLLDVVGVDQLIDPDGFFKLVVRLGINLLAAFVVVRLIYVRLYRWNEYVFTYFAFNIITFLTCFLLRKVPIELGFALGLFAVFGILRYRTEPIRIRDLTYLFVVIGLAILNAVANKKISLAELMFVNVSIVASTWVLEYSARGRRYEESTIIYDNLELLKPGREADLAADIRERTGLPIQRAEIYQVDLLQDTARIRVSWAESKGVREIS